MSLKYVTKKLEDQSLEEEENLSQKVSPKRLNNSVKFLAAQASFGWVRHFEFFVHTKKTKNVNFQACPSLREAFLIGI